MINNLGFKGTSRYQEALSGMVGGALALAFGELGASATNKSSSLVLAVG